MMTDYASETDKALLGRLRKGSRSAYRALFDRYWEFTYNTIYKRLKSHDQAEDLTQDIFLKLWVRREAVSIENLAGYLATAARYSVYRAMEQQQLFVPIDDLIDALTSSSNQTDAPLLAKEFFLAFEAAVGDMPPARRQIFRLRYVDGFTPNQIAAQLGVSPKTVRNQLGRALQAFKTFALVMMSVL